MEHGRKGEWWDNPLGVGAVGFALLVLGYLAMNVVPPLGPEEGGTLRTPPFLWPGRIIFLVGLGVVARAGVLWYRLAQQPEAEEEVPEEANEEGLP